MTRTQTFHAQAEQVQHLCQFVLAGAEQTALTAKNRAHIELACDEAASNIIEHAYQGKPGDIVVTWAIVDKTFRITFADTGQSFRPETVPAVAPVDENTPIEAVSIGGLGVHFMRTLMDDVIYQFDDNGNKVTLVKNIPEQNDTAVSTRPLTDQIDEQIHIVSVIGRLDQTTIPDLETHLQALLAQSRYNIILDLSETTYTNSGGLRIIVAAWREARQHDGDLVLAGLNLPLQEIFSMVGFDKILNIVNNIEEAGALMANG